MTRPNCRDADAGGPDFLFNAKPENLEMAYEDDCLSEVSLDDGPTFLVNAYLISSGSPERQLTLLVNTELIMNPNVVVIEDKC